MTEKEINALLSQGKDFCDFFEHVLIRLNIITKHNPIGCKWCVYD